MIEITQKDIQLLSFLKRYKVISLKDSNKIYSSEWYHYKRLKQLEDERYIKKVNRFQIKLDVIQTKNYVKKKINTDRECLICTYSPLEIVDKIN